MKTKSNKTELLPVLVSIVNLIASVIFITRLPETVPMHYGVDWVCDRVGSPWGGIIMPVFLLVVTLAAPPIYRLTEKAENKERGSRVFQITILMICMFFMALGWLILLSMGTGVQPGEKADALPFGWLLSLCLAFMFIGQGNYLPIMPQSRTLGIKIRYTLENEACWKLTHRFAGKLWVMTGIMYLLLSLIAMLLHVDQIAMFILLFVVMTVNMGVPVIYAYQNRDAKN